MSLTAICVWLTLLGSLALPGSILAEPTPSVGFFDDFSTWDPSSWYIAGDTTWNAADQDIVLTRAAGFLRARLYRLEPFQIDRFLASFDLRIGGGSGADGMTFALVEDYGYPAFAGGTLDFLGAYAVEFDQWHNSEISEPAAPHVAVVAQDTIHHLASVPVSNLRDDAWHHVEILFNRGLVNVEWDGATLLTTSIADFAPFGGYVGMTAATGLLADCHRVDNLYFCPLYELSVRAAPEEGGSVTGSGLFPAGTEATVTAEPQPGWRFVEWAGPVVDAGSPTTSVLVDSDVVVTAHFVLSSAPVAAFSGTPRAGSAPLSVAFSDETTGTVDSWFWDFGDGGTSAEQHPARTYATAGSYTVSLTATNAAGSDTETKPDYISVAPQSWFEDDDPAITYTGAWSALSHPRASAGHLRYSAQTNAKASFTFTGTGVRWHVAYGPQMGKAEVYLGSTQVGLIDLYSPALKLVTLQATNLAPGPHTIQIVVSGEKNPKSSGTIVTLDALEVVP